MNVPHLSALENAVIAAILQSLPKAENCLTEQLRQSELQSRDHNGYGFFTFWHYQSQRQCAWKVMARMRRRHWWMENFADSFFGSRDGKIDFFEGYPLGGDAWPQNEIFETITLNVSHTEPKS